MVLISAAGVAPLLGQDTTRVVRGLAFSGNASIEAEALSAAIGTTNSSWFATSPVVKWLGLGEKRYFDEIEFRRDVLRLVLLYRQSGFMEVQVDTVVRRTGRDVYLKFVIREGEPVQVTSFTVTGLDSVPDAEEIRRDLPLRVGKPFNRLLFLSSADSIVRRLRDRGYPAADLLRQFSVDRVRRTAELSLEAVPGPRAVFGGVTVTGGEHVDSSFIRQLLIARPGRPFSQDALYESQRKLYQTELFRLATVGIDSSRYTPEDSVVPLAVRVSEGKKYRLRSGVGYATYDCLRATVGLTDRNLFGSGRLFDVSANLSKIGVGAPLGFGLENSICKALQGDVIGSSRANYNVTASIRQPRALGSPRNTGTYAVFAERRSEFNVYRREDVGASWSVTRATARKIPVTGTYKLSYGHTTASSATFCAFFNACTAADIGLLSENRLVAILSASVSWPRANNPLDPTRGYQATVEAAHSSRFIGSSRFEQFTRFAGDIAWYRPIGRSVVLSAHLRAGIIFSPRVVLDTAQANFTPPEERFYAGGPNDVRGFDRNELGPVVYVAENVPDSFTVQQAIDSINSGSLKVRFSPTGGNTLAIGNLELRVPSPIFSSRMRLALFVDAGTLFERGNTGLYPAVVRFTPGAGIRVATPLGPVRLDVAYNGYRTAPGALYLSRASGQLELAQGNFARPRGSKWNLQFAVGQPF
jgi:outer membrane protein assembly complex protein YaeT